MYDRLWLHHLMYLSYKICSTLKEPSSLITRGTSDHVGISSEQVVAVRTPEHCDPVGGQLGALDPPLVAHRGVSDHSGITVQDLPAG
jgi:hypothetical protein